MKQWQSDKDSIYAQADRVTSFYALRKTEIEAPKPFDMQKKAQATVLEVNKLPESVHKDCARKLVLMWHPGEC